MTQHIEWFYAKYIGGHAEYPKLKDCKLFLYHDHIRLHLWNGYNHDIEPTLIIPYQSIKNIHTMDDKKKSSRRVVALALSFVPLAIVRAMQNKYHNYTVIEFEDHVGSRAIILDMGKRVTYVQSWIHHMMMTYRQGSVLHPTDGFIVYENRRYGFKITFPENWVMDEFDEGARAYTKVVQFRKSIENKPPFVTLYLTHLDTNSALSKNFVNEQVKEIKNDSKRSIIEASDIIVADNPAFKLTYVEHKGYKRMVTWIPADKRVYEISYSSMEEEFLDDLPVVENMINSIQISNEIAPIAHDISIETGSTDDPLVILKARFAKGEITQEDFDRMQSVLQRSE